MVGIMIGHGESTVDNPAPRPQPSKIKRWHKIAGTAVLVIASLLIIVLVITRDEEPAGVARAAARHVGAAVPDRDDADSDTRSATADRQDR